MSSDKYLKILIDSQEIITPFPTEKAIHKDANGKAYKCGEYDIKILSPKKGNISLKLGYRGSDSSFIYPFVSTLSLCTLNLFGFPWDRLEESLEIEVQIMNNKREVIKRYVESVNNHNYVAVWWGYEEHDIYRKVAADNIRTVLANIRHRINNDSNEIKKQLK